MIRKIIARNGNRILLRVTGLREQAGNIEEVNRYEIWYSEDKMNANIKREKISDKTSIYCVETKGNSELEIMFNFFNK